MPSSKQLMEEATVRRAMMATEIMLNPGITIRELEATIPRTNLYALRNDTKHLLNEGIITSTQELVHMFNGVVKVNHYYLAE